jgi:hypothetical protein
MNLPGLRALVLVWVAGWCSPAALAQPIPPEAPAPAVPATAEAPPPPAPPAPPPPASCADITGRAMAAEVRLTQSTQAPVSEQLQQQDVVLGLWRDAVQRCDGRARERAERLLLDNQRSRARLAEREQAGAQCELSLRDAASLQELAKTAFAERRWLDAAALYRKSETLWDLGSEHCKGEQQQLAAKRREETEIDAHNAEVCAPAFERARGATQRLRALGPEATARERESQIAETLWREAGALCKGPALELARTNAQALARERGTPWVATAGTGDTPAPGPQRGAGFATVASAVAPSAPPTPPAAATPPTEPSAAAVASALPPPLATTIPVPVPVVAPSAAPTPAPRAAEAASRKPQPGELDVQAGDARYTGRFELETGGAVTGEGRVVWANGDVYQGQLVRSKRQGQGSFTWANGQRYSGQWVADRAQGQGEIVFVNGNRYVGAVLDDQPQGQGTMHFASGDRYSGAFESARHHGAGTYTWANGQSLEGQWVEHQAQGPAVVRYPSGNVYEGPVRAGVAEGRGRLRFASGDVYEGDFVAGQMEGEGQYRWLNGDRYEGRWQAGRKEGRGVFFWASGDRFEGQFKDDQRTEDGVLIRKE